MVFYRKYRPQTITDLDSASLRETLSAVLQKNVPHAFLFTGPKGLGKTSTARIIAKVVNCTGKKEGGIEPCNTCDSCISITANTNVDILEIDAASNRGIDEIRELKDKIRLSPVSSKKKVYIIDEVHMLTTEAFNALLKTLEEPPDHAMFILCTTEPQKVPATILSRCFHISFHLATPEELVRSFTRIITSENASVDTDALLLIGQMAEGGFRDGVKILEEVISLAKDKPVTKAFLEERYQLASTTESVSNFLTALQKKDAKLGMSAISDVVTRGIDMKYFLQKVTEEVHMQLLIAVAADKKQPPKTQFGVTEMQDLFFLLTRAGSEIKYAVLPQLPLEMVLLDWVQQQPAQEPSPIKSTGSILVEDVTVSSLRKKIGNIKRIKALYGDSAVPTPAKPKVTVATTTVELQHTPGDGEVTTEWLELFWKNFIHEMKNHNHTVAGLLRGCKIKEFSKENLIIEAAYSFHKERLDELKTREALVNVCKLLTGKDMEIKVELKV